MNFMPSLPVFHIQKLNEAEYPYYAGRGVIEVLGVGRDGQLVRRY